MGLPHRQPIVVVTEEEVEVDQREEAPQTTHHRSPMTAAGTEREGEVVAGVEEVEEVVATETELQVARRPRQQAPNRTQLQHNHHHSPAEPASLVVA